MNTLNVVGIDVSAQTLSAAIQRSRGGVAVATFANQGQGHRQLLKWATKGGRCARVCLEATGSYSLGLALALHRHPKVEVMVVNPKAIKNYGGAMMQRAKTDEMDAQLILDYGQRMPFVAWQPPNDQTLKLQAITRRIVQLKTERTRELNRLHAYSFRGNASDVVGRDLQVHIRQVERRLVHLEQKALELVEAAPVLHTAFQRLLSIPGIGQATALRVLAEVLVLPKDLKVGQWVAHAGLDPRPHTSGTSVQKQSRISKAGNKYLRTALYMSALVALQRQIHIKAFYEKLIRAGKKPIKAVVAVMRKLVHTIFGVLKHNQDFVGEKFYKMAG
jgi:transposase